MEGLDPASLSLKDDIKYISVDVECAATGKNLCRNAISAGIV